MAKKLTKQEALLIMKECFKKADTAPSQKEANKWVKKARRVAMKKRITLPQMFKRRVCKHCYSHLKPGINVRTRIHKGIVITLCKECKKFVRMPIKKRK